MPSQTPSPTAPSSASPAGPSSHTPSTSSGAALHPGTVAPTGTSEGARGGSGAIWSESWKPYRGVPQLTVAADLFAFLLTALVWRAGGLQTLVLALAFLVIFVGSRQLYRSRLTLSVLEDLPELAGRVVIGAALGAVTLTLLGSPLHWMTGNRAALGFPATFLALLVLGRIVAYTFIRWARARRRVGHRTVIIGAGRVGRQIATILAEHPHYGLNVLGFLDDDPLDGEDGPPVLGPQAHLEAQLRALDARIVVIAFTRSDAHLVETIRACDKLDIEVFIVPRLFELHQVEGDMDSVWGLPLVRLRRATHRSWTWQVKRLMDIACSGLAVVVLSPLMALIALGVRLDGGPGIIFRQQRVGVDGEPVEVMKFRSMRPVNEAESQTNWNISNDNRLSKFGKFIRKTSLDELPQLFNILKGDMSIVGPRPERPFFVEQFQELYPSYDARHRVPCGLTGWAAVNGLRGDTSIEDRARFDNYYIQNWSLWLDVKIILRTVGAVFTGAGG